MFASQTNDRRDVDIVVLRAPNRRSVLPHLARSPLPERHPASPLT